MTILLLSLLALFALALAAGSVRLLWYRRHKRELPAVRLLAAVSRKIEYYDDEELDNYRGRHSDDYSNAEVEQFQDILYTMRSDEVAGWVRSLQLRGVELPDELKDEVFMIVGERRM